MAIRYSWLSGAPFMAIRYSWLSSIDFVMNGHLVLVGRVERDFTDLGVLLPVSHHPTMLGLCGKLCALQDCSFRSVAVDLSLQDGFAHVFRCLLEFGTVAENSNLLECFESGALLVIAVLHRLVFRSVNLNNLVVKPHVRHCHPVL